MNKLYGLLSNKKLMNASLYFFVLVCLILFVIKSLNTNFLNVGNNDDYKGFFMKFQQQGYYNAVAQGTTIFYNLFLSFFFTLTKNINASFFILNLLSNLVLLFFGYFFLSKIIKKKDWIFYSVAVIYACYILDMRTYLSASNDTFLGVFIMLLLYVLVVKLFEEANSKITFFSIGLLFAICLSIRITAILLLPLIFLVLFYCIRATPYKFIVRVKLLAIGFVTFISVIAIFHYPSLKEKHQLSYEDKNPSNGLNWIQRNYLGLKKIENGEEKMHRDAIWVHTKFEKVQSYIDLHGENSLPKTFTEALIMDPVLVLKITIINIITSLLRFFRFWGLLFLIPIIALFKNNILKSYKLPILLFLLFMGILSFVCFTFIEFRWFFGYEILVPISILLAIKQNDIALSSNKIMAITTVSLLLISLFNIRTIITTL